MKSVGLSLFLLLIAVPAVMADPAEVGEGLFPVVSKIQVRQPVTIERRMPDAITNHHDACGPNPSIPYNCTYACVNGEPQHDENGDPVLICWYEPGEGGGGCSYGSLCGNNGFCYTSSLWRGCNSSYYNCSNC